MIRQLTAVLDRRRAPSLYRSEEDAIATALAPYAALAFERGPRPAPRRPLAVRRAA